MRLFFIDYENVGSAGMRGISGIHAEDRVYLFYTVNSNKLDFALYQELTEIHDQVEMIQVVTGNNSLDFQLCTFLGSLTPSCHSDSFVIVSKDKGYNSVVSFWQERGIHISQVNNMELEDDSAILSDLKEKLPQYEADIPEIVSMIRKYKTRQGLNNALCKIYGNEKTAVINKAIKIHIKDKKSH